MSVSEETIDAMLDLNGELRLTHQPRLPPGPVRVTIRAIAAVAPERGLADVIRELAGEQRSRGFPGRSSHDMSSEDKALLDEDVERDAELDATRRGSSPGHRECSTISTPWSLSTRSRATLAISSGL
jgi:hypothetical protein